MAAVIELERLQRVLELHCSCCLQLFAEPVRVTGCGHSFCRGCILRYCAGRRRAACPLCRRAFEPQHLRPNRELAALLSLIPRDLNYSGTLRCKLQIIIRGNIELSELSSRVHWP
uniref:RING-type domain-containing protein n=1 Tax=Taeniopygia guttata TaxID=59729 RepID=A0A674GFD9_TAEGU